MSNENELDASGVGPCSKPPCRATVLVDSVLGYGSSFGAPLAAGRSIRAEFTFTLAATTPVADTWWTPWFKWLSGHSGRRVAPPSMGSLAAGLPPLEAAPGLYVHER